MVILDTNVIIDHLRQKGTAKTLMEKLVELEDRQDLAISIVTLQELYEGASTRDERKEKDLLGIINSLRILDYSYAIAKKAGELARDAKQPMEFADASIAATAIINGARLFTLNRRDFAYIQGLALYDPSF